MTIVNQDTFTESYLRVGGKNYMFNGDLDRLFTIQKLCMIAYDTFRGECFRNNRHYDIIVKMRPDIFLHEKLNINIAMTDNQIVVPTRDSGGCFNDHIAFGKSRVMERYLTYYRTFHEIDRLDGGRACDVSIIEAGVRKNLDVARIEIVRNNIKYEILRDIKPQKIQYFGNNKNKKNNFFIKKY